MKVFRKREKKEQKERFSNWAPRIWTITDIKQDKGQEMYFLEDNGQKAPKPYFIIRHFLLGKYDLLS